MLQPFLFIWMVMDMDDSLYLPKEHNLAMLAMFGTHFGSWRDSWSAVVQYKSRSAMHSYSWYIKLRTGRLQVIGLFRLVFVYPSQTAWYSQGKNLFKFTRLIESFSRLWSHRGAGMVEWHSSPTNMTRVRSPDPPPYQGRVCFISSGFSAFPPSTKTNTSKF